MKSERAISLSRRVRCACAVVATACLIAALSGVARAQPLEASPRALQSRWSVFAGFSWHAFSEPGLHLGGELALVCTQHFESLLSMAFQAYGVGGSETGYALQARWGQRYSFGFGLTFDSYIGIGAQYSIWETTVFRFENARGEATHAERSGIAVIPHVAVGPGYDLSRLTVIPLHLYTRVGLMLLYPDMNDVFRLSAFAELGIRWRL